MLNEKIENINLVIDAMINFHRTGNITSRTETEVVTVDQPRTPTSDGILEIAYGYNSTPKGKIKIKDGQFELSEVTKLVETQLEFQKISNYNYQSNLRLLSKQSFINALKSTDLVPNKDYQAIIILTSESCRSVMVRQAMRKLMEEDISFSVDVWNGLKFAFNNYSGTAGSLGYDINAGGGRWEPLTADNYISYIGGEKYKGDKKASVESIIAVKTYIGNSSNTTHQSTSSSSASTSGSHN